MSALATALAFARHRHPTFPCHWPVEHPRHPGRLICSCGGELRGRPCAPNSRAKHPYGRLCPSGLLDATTDSDTLKAWFGRDVPMANLGVCTDRMVVIDIDPRHGGDESFAALEREHGEMPLTWRTITGGGGEHVLFACPDGVEIRNVVAEQTENPPLGRGIDIRARGGYIVVPPSRHISGRPYAWSVDHHPADVELAPAPDWLVERLAARKATPNANGEQREPASSETWQRLSDSDRIISEYRDMAAAQVTGHLLRRWCDPLLVKGLLHAWNQTYCNPPLPDDELRRILNRIARREDQRREAAGEWNK
jgi:bifunctional DNA primase/polymerase-like protein/primase-like protein